MNAVIESSKAHKFVFEWITRSDQVEYVDLKYLNVLNIKDAAPGAGRLPRPLQKGDGVVHCVQRRWYSILSLLCILLHYTVFQSQGWSQDISLKSLSPSPVTQVCQIYLEMVYFLIVFHFHHSSSFVTPYYVLHIIISMSNLLVTETNTPLCYISVFSG